VILKGAEAARYCAKPDPARAGLLIFGADAMRVALKRQEAIAALIGPDGAAEMRLTRISAGDLRKDASLLLDAIKEVGFFPGPRVCFVEEATDGLLPVIATALTDWKPGDATILVTAGNLTGKSTLKGLFEKAPIAVSIGLYDEPPSRDEIEAELKKARLTQLSPAAMADLTQLARALDPGDFRQTLEKIALYKYGDATPLTPAEVAAMAPATLEADVDEVLNASADGRAAAVGLLMSRLSGQGVVPVTICLMALRHFRSLHVAATDPGGVNSGMMKARIFGTRRDQMQKQVQAWSVRSLESVIAQLLEADMTLRSASRAPGMAVVERLLIRIAMTKR